MRPKQQTLASTDLSRTAKYQADYFTGHRGDGTLSPALVRANAKYIRGLVPDVVSRFAARCCSGYLD
jgi:hypothetical protein